MAASAAEGNITESSVQASARSNLLKQALKTLREATDHVDSIIDEGNDVHCPIFMSSEEQNRQVGYPIYSPLLVSAFNVDSWGASIVSNAVSDALLVV